MTNLRIGVISDLHLYNKTANVEKAFSKLCDTDLILIVGDIADRADEKQYSLMLQIIDCGFREIPICCVSGNHDNPARDDTNYRQFEKQLNAAYRAMTDVSGAFFTPINALVSIVGLNPTYHQKQFYFPDKGRQLSFLQEKLDTDPCKYNIVMCHPPLLAHNPQRAADAAPYIVREQDTRLQSILDSRRNIIFLSGHTHIAPSVEFDALHGTLYINDGSICPTTVKGTDAQTQQGNVTVLEISERGLSVVIKGIHGDCVFFEQHFAML